jgi:hypothetical protein
MRDPSKSKGYLQEHRRPETGRTSAFFSPKASPSLAILCKSNTIKTALPSLRLCPGTLIASFCRRDRNEHRTIRCGRAFRKTRPCRSGPEGRSWPACSKGDCLTPSSQNSDRDHRGPFASKPQPGEVPVGPGPLLRPYKGNSTGAGPPDYPLPLRHPPHLTRDVGTRPFSGWLDRPQRHAFRSMFHRGLFDRGLDDRPRA